MLIIFDCDGVLRSVSWNALYEGYLAIAKYLKVNPLDFWSDVQEFKEWHDTDWHLNLEQMGVAKGSDYAPINKLFHEIYDPHICTFPWVGGVMKELASKHYLAVLSAALSSSVAKSLDGSAGFISLIKGCEHVKNVKPHPEGIHLIMEEAGASPEKTLMIGDTYADILAGKQAGVKTAGVSWGLETAEDLQNLDPDFMFTNPRELCLIK